MEQDQDQDKRLEEIKQKLLFKMGTCDAMASHSKAVAGSLKEAADHHGGKANYHLNDLGAAIQQHGVGTDPDAEKEYCRLLVERHRLGEAYELAANSEQRFPDLQTHADHLQKSLHRLPPAAVHHDYVWGTVTEGTLLPEEDDDFRPRLYDAQELLPREVERDKDPAKVDYFRDLYSRRAPEEIHPVVLVRTEHGREILDGHHRWMGAKEAERPVRAVEISGLNFDYLKDLGFTDMDIAYAALAMGDCWDAADGVKSQYDGKPVRRTGFLAYERLMKKGMGIYDEYE